VGVELHINLHGVVYATEKMPDPPIYILKLRFISLKSPQILQLGPKQSLIHRGQAELEVGVRKHDRELIRESFVKGPIVNFVCWEVKGAYQLQTEVFTPPARHGLVYAHIEIDFAE
jgi:hypothetical protein